MATEHCSTCQTHNTASNCGSKVESFKNLFGTEVQKNESYLNIESLIPHPKVNEIITKETWDKITTILQAIKDYGELDENNPSQDKIDNSKVNENSVIYLANYNSILNALDQQQLNSKTIITKELIDQLEQYIKQYNINDTRCNICNVKCENEQGCYCNCDCNCGECGDCGIYHQGIGDSTYYNTYYGYYSHDY